MGDRPQQLDAPWFSQVIDGAYAAVLLDLPSDKTLEYTFVRRVWDEPKGSHFPFNFPSFAQRVFNDVRTCVMALLLIMFEAVGQIHVRRVCREPVVRRKFALDRNQVVKMPRAQ